MSAAQPCVHERFLLPPNRAQDDLLLYYGHDYEWMDDQKDDMYLLHLNHPEQQPEIQQLSIQLKHRYGVDAADF